MSELKFRAWIKRYQKYMPVSMINFNPVSGKIVSIEVVAIGGDWCKLYPEEYILEQYTGLKDKNGKEIYEGDILLDDTGEPLEYWRVRYIWGKFVGECNLVSEDIFELRDLEAIGDIHENQDLLSGTNVTDKEEE